jgi:hypothetical protein
VAQITYLELISQFEQRGLSGRHLTAKQGAFLYSLWMREERCPVQARAANGAKAITDTLPDGRAWRLYQEWNQSWRFQIEGEPR